MSTISATLNIMIRAAERAARSLTRDFGEVENLQVSRKGPGDFVSAADRRAEEIIYEELSKARPDTAFLMEEQGVVAPIKAGDGNPARWIIDPLDGTSNFLHGLPHWAISIAYEEKGEITAGLVYDPIKNELFTAERNKGAFMRRKRLRVSGRVSLVESMIATGAPRRSLGQKERFLKECDAVIDAGGSLRRYGAASLDLTYVAAGRYDGYWERSLKPWDVAAGYLIVREAGGFGCDLDSDSNNAVETGNILVANEGCYQPLKKLIRACG